MSPAAHGYYRDIPPHVRFRDENPSLFSRKALSPHNPDSSLYSLPEILTAEKPVKKGGYLFIGDVAFETEDELSKCRQEAAEEWDEEEFYFVADQLREAFPDLQFTKISHCAGVITLPA